MAKGQEGQDMERPKRCVNVNKREETLEKARHKIYMLEKLKGLHKRWHNFSLKGGEENLARAYSAFGVG